MSNGWIAVDLDGTLAEYKHGEFNASHVGKPIPKMVDRVAHFMKKGKEVRIFTARIFPLNTCIEAEWTDAAIQKLKKAHLSIASNSRDVARIEQAATSVLAIRAWTKEVFGRRMTVTNIKDYSMIVLYDDRAHRVIENTGIVVGEKEQE